MPCARFLLIVLLAQAAGVTGCGRRETTADASPLLEADRAFARAVEERGAEGWAGFFLEEGVMFPRRGRIDGRAAILERMRGAFADSTHRLRWEPQEGLLAQSGDLGYTIGRWRSEVRDSTGGWRVESTGRYVTIWRKDAEGRWRVAVDIGNDDPPDSLAVANP